MERFQSDQKLLAFKILRDELDVLFNQINHICVRVRVLFSVRNHVHHMFRVNKY